MASTNGETDQVLVEEKSSVRIFTLNRPKQLNALSHTMVSRLLELFLACAEDPSVKLIILKNWCFISFLLAINIGKGRAFCAGGDVAAVVRDLTQAFCYARNSAGTFPRCRCFILFVKTPWILWLKIINKCFSRRSVEEIIAALEREAADKKDDWISSTIQSLKKASPMSLKISFRSWEPSNVESISDDMVDRYFSKVNDREWEDLKLPVRSNLPAYAIAKL
ncbi:3-hydroxyisobutyryl-CoA hydrolase 1 [Sesamum angolense]|uniref:3-hydroxyisobutyryl-CoA hydrolase n=1 Tax=Sesamum angolense TaxID=2727404 RepID=A0AAE2BTG5_9LAMI|nr:3-hydroxyisobutyryl-CoA hydrolase 1 [Sesamum angolense]